MWILILGFDGFDDLKVVEKVGSKYVINVFFLIYYFFQDIDK